MINFKDKKTIFYICFALAYVVAFALASVYDFRISRAIADVKTGEYYSDNLFGRVFAVIGEMPVYAVSSFAVSVFYANVPETYAKKTQIFLKALCLAITFGVLFFGFNRMFKNISNLTNSFDRRHVAIILAEVFLAAAVPSPVQAAREPIAAVEETARETLEALEKREDLPEAEKAALTAELKELLKDLNDS